MFNCYVWSILEFNSCVWSPSEIGLINQIENVQKRFTKRIPALTNLGYSDRLRILKQDTLESRRLKTDLVQTYKIITGLDKINFEDFFSFRPHAYICKRNSRCLFPFHRNTSLRSNSFTFRVVPIWNTLPNNIVMSATLATFKNGLKSHDLSNFLKFRFEWLFYYLYIFVLTTLISIYIYTYIFSVGFTFI